MDLNNVKILTARKWNNYFPLQVVYEWEDILAKELNIGIDESSLIEINEITGRKISSLGQKIIRNSFLSSQIDSSFNFFARKYPQHYFLSFFLYPLPINNHYIYSNQVLPILLDCFSDVIDKVPVYFKKSKILFLTNLEVFEYLKHSEIGHKIVYLPLSISDKYYTGQMPTKDIDVLQMGRQNPVLHEWMLALVKKFPAIEYVYSVMKDNVHTYFSTTKGWIGPAENRQEFMKLLSRAKVSLLSSPGVDGGQVRTGGLNPVTPRFFESAVSYCYMAGRYATEGADFKYCKVADVCPHFDDYETFERTIPEMVNTPFRQKDRYNKFIDLHLTSKRASIVSSALKNLEI